ncbi:MAG: hypothetical protein IJ877_03645 [Candidatus Gastranaerophilales bacterium]|nr:hypothetical protein [Candidatus Gastranaerophilales bacterium]
MTVVNKTKYLEFKCAKSPTNSDWHYVKRTNDKEGHDSAVVITTIVKKPTGYNFLFITTDRPPLKAENKALFCLESPAGLIADEDENEQLLDCVKKELLQETGYKPDKIFVELKNSSTSAGLTSETITYVTAVIENDVIHEKPLDDGGIIKDRFFIPVSKIYSFFNMVDTSKMSIASSTICGVFYALVRVKLLT